MTEFSADSSFRKMVAGQLSKDLSRRAVLGSAGGLGLALLMAACGSPQGTGSSGSGSGAGGVLKIAMSAGNIPFPSTPPNEGYEGYRFVGNNIYDGLTRLNLDQDGELPEPQPSLAEKWDISADLTTWTFALRQDVKFQDGTDFNADAVIFQFDRLRNKEFQYYDAISAGLAAAAFRFFKSWQKIDDYTVQVTTSEPYAWLHWDLAGIYFPSPAVVKEFGNTDYNQHATGTGPYKMTKYVNGQVMELTRNDGYWGGPAKLEQIVLYPQPEAASRLSMLQSGEVNWAEVPSPDSLDQLEADGFQIMLAPYPHGIMPRFNMFREPFKDNLALRQALNYALDREGTAALINSVGYAAKQYVYEGHPAYATNNPGYSYDLGKAKSMMAEAGYGSGGLSITMAYPSGGSGNMYPDVMMQKLQSDFAAIGVKVQLMPLEWNTIISIGLDGLNSDKWKGIDILWASPAAGMMPTGYSATFFSQRPGGMANAAGLADTGIDQNLRLASQQADPAQQNEYLRKTMDIAVSQAYFLFWMHDRNLRVFAPEVQGYVKAKSWWVDFTTISAGR
jgi:peptide/nickel transport system substrate-binding protein